MIQKSKILIYLVVILDFDLNFQIFNKLSIIGDIYEGKPQNPLIQLSHFHLILFNHLKPIPTLRVAPLFWVNSLFIVFSLKVLLLKVGALNRSRVHHRHEWLERHELLLVLTKRSAHVWKTTCHHSHHRVHLRNHRNIAWRLASRELS
jgi:hypothetical protein